MKLLLVKTVIIAVDKFKFFITKKSKGKKGYSLHKRIENTNKLATNSLCDTRGNIQCLQIRIIENLNLNLKVTLVYLFLVI